MSAVYPFPSTSEPESIFADAIEAFDELKGYLESGASMTLEHSELERQMEKRGREILRRLLEAHVNLRCATAQPVSAVVGQDENERTHRRRGARRTLSTIFGFVEVKRTAYSGRGQEALHPTDAALNLPSERYSHEIRRRAAHTAAGLSFDSTLSTLAELTDTRVPKRQLEELVRRSSQDFEAFYKEREVDESSNTDTGEILALSFDGKGIVVRHQDLRAATRKAAEESQPKLHKRVSKGEKRGRKRMATVGAVYTIAPWKRKADDIIKELHPVRIALPKSTRPRPESKRVWASVKRSPEDVIEDGFQEALRRDPDKKKRWVVVLDGHESQLENVKQAADRHGVKITIILDLFHVIEYLWKAAYCFHDEGSTPAEDWVQKQLKRILEGKAPAVAAGMLRNATRRKLSKRKRKNVDLCAHYITKYSSYVNYDEYLRIGLPIASGVIEGACRHLIGDRLDITGARWSLDGAEAVLRLRALKSSADFDEYWGFHLRQELQRNHLSRYYKHSPVVLRFPSAPHFHLIR